jgi:outer membrane lipoprotein-sorting protein
MKRFQIIAFLISFIIPGSIYLSAQTAGIQLQNMDKLMSAPSDKEAMVKMILTDKTGKVSEREAVMKQKGKDKRLYRYTKPEKQAGICSLSLPNDEMWLYMPAFSEPTKISLLAKSQAFTGTDFSYEDMENRAYSERYTPKLLNSSDPAVNLLELIPISKKSKCSKINLYLDKSQYYPVKMDYFDEKGEIYKTAVYKYVKQGKYWYAGEVLMTDLKKNHSTKIIMTQVKFDQGISDDVFLVEKLKPKK